MGYQRWWILPFKFKVYSGIKPWKFRGDVAIVVVSRETEVCSCSFDEKGRRLRGRAQVECRAESIVALGVYFSRVVSSIRGEAKGRLRRAFGGGREGPWPRPRPKGPKGLASLAQSRGWGRGL